MKQMTYSAIAAAFIALPALAGAQQPNQQPPSPSPAPAPAPAPMPREQSQSADRADKKTDTVKGELVKVDADAKKITIKDSAGVETEFAYTATTEVGGGREGVAGLATKSGSKVTVHFTNDMGTKTATKIEVSGDKKSSQ